MNKKSVSRQKIVRGPKIPFLGFGKKTHPGCCFWRQTNISSKKLVIFWHHEFFWRPSSNSREVVRDISPNFWSKSSSTRSAPVDFQQGQIQGPGIGSLFFFSESVDQVDCSKVKYEYNIRVYTYICMKKLFFGSYGRVNVRYSYFNLDLTRISWHPSWSQTPRGSDS